jgi:hypothetical protein
MEAIGLSLILDRRCDSGSSKSWRIGLKKIKKQGDLIMPQISFLVDEEEQVTR